MVYTLSPDFLQNLEEEDGIYVSDVLFQFTNRQNPLKITKDNRGTIIEDYSKIAETNPHIKTWLDMMSFTPLPFVKVNVDLSQIDCLESKYLKLCKETNGQKKMIIYSLQNIQKFNCENNSVIYEDCPIDLLDKEDARYELNNILNRGDIIINSQVAKNNSEIKDSENK